MLVAHENWVRWPRVGSMLAPCWPRAGLTTSAPKHPTLVDKLMLRERDPQKLNAF